MTVSAVCATTMCFPRSLFTGKERDAESGNDYFDARYYGSSMGRFMSPDWSAQVEPVPYSKLDDPQSLNLYAYVMNNPMDRTDPTGHWCVLGHGTTCSQPAPPPTPAPPAAPPIAVLKTDIKGNTTSFTVSTHEKTTTTTIDTHVVVDSAYKKAHPNAGGPFESTVVGVRENNHGGNNPSYGPNGAYIDVGSPTQENIHGGGSKFGSAAFQDYQGWDATHGCTRGQNADVIKLGKPITEFQKSNPGMPIDYSRE
jgi:RHS repeat-associated protein